MNVVIGSGPAGVAAAASLLDRGCQVTMIDAGGSLEPAIQARVDRLARRSPTRWPAGGRDSVKGPLRFNAEGAPLKLPFGSDYLYRDVDRLQPVMADGVDAYRALATGGLSTVWGAAVLPYEDEDFREWPFEAATLDPYYATALDMTGLAAADDRLSALYRVHMAPRTRLESSSQARFMERRMLRHADRLAQQHIFFGASQLAVIGESTSAGPSCVHCGMCLYGCPYGLIYSARATVDALSRSKDFTYVSGLVVTRLVEHHGCVTIEAVTRDTARAQRFEATRVYLAAGVLGSTAIMLESLGAYGRPIELQQSDHFLLPLLLRRRAGRASVERLHTLSQMFIEIRDRTLSERDVHLQLYTYNDFYARMARNALGPLYRVVAPAAERLIDRLVVIKGYLHSVESSRIRATLVQRPGRSLLHLTAVPGSQSDRIVRGVARLLAKNGTRIGATPIRLGLRKGRPGSGVHVGGSFPMRRNPGAFESDSLGRPTGFTRVHIVDAAVFPTVPAAPPTLTIMANAFRIGAMSADAPTQDVS